MNFNYTLLLILSILLLIQCYLKININIITALLLGILLISNEIYRRKEHFQYCNDPTNCYDPYFYNPKIINLIDQTEVPISDGLLCRLNKNLDKYSQQKDKLNKQYDVINMVKQNIKLNHQYDVINTDEQNIKSPDNQSNQQLKSNDLSIFNPISEIKDNTPCPNVCHLIKDANKCETELEYPPNSTIEQVCQSITDGNICNTNCHCKYDTNENKCKYHKLGCVWLTSTDTDVKQQPDMCHKRCEKYDNKNECNLASGNNINDKDALYCQWDSLNDSANIGNCLPKCNKYLASDICLSDDTCEINKTETQCINKCDSILSEKICKENNHCKFWGNQCQNKKVGSITTPTLPGGEA